MKAMLFDFGMIVFLFLFPHFVQLPFYLYSIPCFLAIYFYLRKGQKNLADIGLKNNTSFLRNMLIGITSALIWVGFMQWMFAPIVKTYFSAPDYTEYDFLRGNISNLLITVAAAWIVGGFYEEIVFRGFINSTLEKYIKSFWAAAFFTSILFGAYHWQQGIFGVVAATLGGFYWSFIYKYFGKNLWNPIFSHAFFDTVTLILIYLGLFGK